MSSETGSDVRPWHRDLARRTSSRCTRPAWCAAARPRPARVMTSISASESRACCSHHAPSVWPSMNFIASHAPVDRADIVHRDHVPMAQASEGLSLSQHPGARVALVHGARGDSGARIDQKKNGRSRVLRLLPEAGLDATGADARGGRRAGFAASLPRRVLGRDRASPGTSRSDGPRAPVPVQSGVRLDLESRRRDRGAARNIDGGIGRD